MAKPTGVFIPIVLCTLMVLALSATCGLAETPAQQGDSFPRPLESYEDADGIWSTLRVRASAEPFNLVATLIFRWSDHHCQRPQPGGHFTAAKALRWRPFAGRSPRRGSRSHRHHVCSLPRDALT